MALRIQTFSGPAVEAQIPALARLRMAVFRAWPYLYEGDPAEEQRHLAGFARSPGAALVVAFADTVPVGCSTCLPLADEKPNVQAPFRARGWDIGSVCYFGESVLLPEYRGQGAGVAFFASREAHARTLPGCRIAAFCAVRRDPADPRRPENAVPLDGFWRRRFYLPLAGMSCRMTWPEVGGGEVVHDLDFWGRALDGGALP